MHKASLTLGIATSVGMVIGFIPFLGILNWLVIPTALLGAVVGIVAVATCSEGRQLAVLGLTLCCVALPISMARLVLGGLIL